MTKYRHIPRVNLIMVTTQADNPKLSKNEYKLEYLHIIHHIKLLYDLDIILISIDVGEIRPRVYKCVQ